MSDIHALSGAYAVDALDDLERAGFERHLAGCAACRAEVASLREATAAMADDVALTPPSELRAAVLDGISRVRPLPPVVVGEHRVEGDENGGPVTRRRWFPALVAAVVLALVGVGAAVWQPWQDDTSTTLTAADRVLADPDAQRVTQELPNGATATIVRSAKEHRAVLVTEDMPAPPAGKVYQLWLQSPADEMVSAGLMPADKSTALLAGDADDAIGAGISVEPEGGSEQPTDVVALFDFEAV
jgi:anti-sigma-K factor RskA